MESLLTDRLATLSHPQRMAVFRLLMRRCPDDLPAGEIASTLNLKASTASVYLSALTQVGLISQRRDGTRLRYAVNLDATKDVVGGLFVDCCRGRADLCPPQYDDLLKSILPTTDAKLNVLFICTGNSARSIIAETLLREMAGDKFTAYSAGTLHRSELNPLAVAVLQAKGHDISRLRAKSVTEFQQANAPKMDFVFTVCDHAANEDCPTWAGQPVSGHWGVPDPVKATGTEAQMRGAFHRTYAQLHKRIHAFTSLPFESLDRGSLQTRIDEIAKETATQE
jgi:protein-tyrosine-phosphatase/predicted transcriptional regulator